METAPPRSSDERTPSYKFGLVVLLAALLAIPLFSVYLLVYDRKLQSATARDSIVTGWGSEQTIAGPYLVLPYSHSVQATSNENGQVVTRTAIRDDALYIAATDLSFDTRLDPSLRHRSIYEAVIYTADTAARGTFRLPDFAALNIDPASVRLGEADIRLGLSDAKGLAGSRPTLVVDGRTLPLIPGSGLSQSSKGGFTGRLGFVPLADRPLPFTIRFTVRGHDTLALSPSAQDTRWHVTSSWPSPSFLGGFLPVGHHVAAQGFVADWRIGNLALNRPIVSVGEQEANDDNLVSVALLDPVDLYSEVNRATKYGFLFIGFTFVALLMFDILAGVVVPGPTYLLVGAGLILFFVLLLAFAEVIGFTLSYLLASFGIVTLISTYAAAILRSWTRAGVVAAMLVSLYAVLYVLLSLEAFSLLIGSLLMFAALSGVMYVTRRVDWRNVGSQTGSQESI